MDDASLPGTPPRRGLAVASLGLGIASYALCLGPFSGIPAIITGHVALGRSRRSPATHGGTGKAIAGMVLGYVSLLVGLPLIAIVLSVATPKLLAARERSRDLACVANLKTIARAAGLHADSHEHRYPTNFAELAPQLGSPRTLWCPTDSIHTPLAGPDWGRLGPDNISYGLLLPGANPAEAPNRPVVRCPIHGSMVLADGSVQRGKIGPGRKKRDRGP